MMRKDSGIGGPAGERPSDPPPNLRVARTPDDLPNIDAILSGDGKGQLRIPDSHRDLIAVFRSGKEAYIVADVTLHGTDQSTAIFQQLRSTPELKSVEVVKVKWAIASLISEIQKLKANSASSASNNSSVATAQTEAAARFREWVDYALEEKASDIHVEVRRDIATVRFRIDGELETMRNENNGKYLSSLAQNTVAYVYNKMTDTKSQSGSQFQANAHMYSMVSYGEGENKIKLRCQTISLVNGFDLIARVLKTETNQKVLTYRELGYTESQSKLIEDATASVRGMILISGVTGSGKTTTLKTIMQTLPGRDHMKLATIEDPVEYVIDGVSQTALQRDVSDEEGSKQVFNEAVKSWMRGDPDLMMLGEIRDNPSGIAAITEAETGHMALGTVHANSAPGIIQRLVSPAIGVDLHALTAPDILSLLVYQALVPKLCPHCKVSIDAMPPAVINSFKKVAVKFNVDVWGMCFKKAGGCEHCKFRGTKGMTVAAEIIKPDRKFLSLMRERREFDAIDHWLSASDGFYDTEDMTGKTVFQHAFYLALQGEIDGYAPERFEKYEHVEMREEKRQKGK